MEEVKKIELKSIKHYEGMSEGTFCFEANLYVNGKAIGRVSNRGCGGCHDYDFDWKEEEKLNKWCKANLPKWKMSDTFAGSDDKELDTDLEMHINNLVCNFLEKKDLKREFNKAVVVIDDTCDEGESWKWRFSKYKGMSKMELIGGVNNAVSKDKTFVNPVILNALPFEKAFNLYYKKGGA